MSRSSFFVVVVVPTQSSFYVLFFCLFSCFLVFVLFGQSCFSGRALSRFSLLFVVVPLSCPVRPTTKEMDHNFVSFSLFVSGCPVEWMGEEETGQNTHTHTKKRKTLPNGQTYRKCSGGRRMRAGAFGLALLLLYLLLSLSS